MSKASLKKTPAISSIPPIGLALVEQDSCEVTDGTDVLIVKQYNSMPSNTSEPDRLASLLDRKIQRRLRKQREIHKIDHELGDIMRLFRTNVGITLAGMAYKLDMDFRHLYEIEQGKRSASLLDLVTIFSQYDIPITQAIIHAKKRS